MKTLIFDIETNGQLYDCTTIHCIVIAEGENVAAYYDSPVPGHTAAGSIAQGIDRLAEASTVVGHNIAAFDLPVIKKLSGIDVPGKVIDTLLLSYILEPNSTAHSLEGLSSAWSLPVSKIQVTDWSSLTDTMLTRCIHDVKINKYVYEKYLSMASRKGFTETLLDKVVSLETKVAKIHAKQVLKGVYFDVDKALQLVQQFDNELEQLRKEIVANQPPKLAPHRKPAYQKWLKTGELVHDVTKPFKKDGTLKSLVEKWRKNENIRGPFNRITWEPFNLDSPKQVTDFLLSEGWKPTTWNFVTDKKTGKTVKSSPKLTEDSYGTLPKGLGEKIGRYKMLSHRRRFLLNQKDMQKGALMTVRTDDRVPAEAMTCCTPTARYRHTKTVCNIPRPNRPYGGELRSLFRVPKGKLQVGVDLSGIEARMMCHYVLAVAYASGDAAKITSAKEMVDLVINRPKSDDFHTFNARTWGVTRDTAKSGLYALMYGCGKDKLASTLSKPKNQGQKLMDSFWKKNAPLKDVIVQLELAYQRNGFIRSLDRRPMFLREQRKALNTLLQGSAAIVFKNWMINVDAENNPKASQIIAYHDELQFEFDSDDENEARRFGERVCEIAEETGRQLKILVPITAEYKVGKTWEETH